ncbi:cadherin-like domain-containing protein [Leisingera caerulea]|uniref:cadherin-like domain-containing protein n=1 Tax=Leisingera caerulea TaxID=506591 RepID=UPI0021A856AA|nr:cadherin-like domain-containing protein [Leisingera caerulea]UWQ86122.1 cadherin-like domain-containing protein [Leisingera caerulea]
MFSSDDFSGGPLDPSVWTVEGPAGVSASTGASATDAYLELVTPDGNYDAWKINNSARAMQDIADEDFQVEARFLTTPTERFQLQGILVEQDAGNWVRFDTYSDGNVLRVFAGVTVDGSSSSRVRAVIPAGEAQYLRVDRAGDVWTYEYSADGISWTTAVSFTHALNATSAGVFAGNTAQAAGYTAQVDYFEVAGDPIADEDGSITPANTAPVAQNDNYLLAPDGSLTVDAGGGVLSNDSDPDGDPLTVSLETQAASGTVSLNADGSFSYTPDAGASGSDSFRYTLSDGTDSVTATVTLTASGPGGGPIAQDAPVLTTGTPVFSKVIVSTAMPLTHVGLGADFDGDGDIDVVATSEQNDSVVWFENDGAENFTAHVIDTALESSYPASVADLDQDGDPDILAGGYRDDLYVWYENDGSGSFQRHTIAAKDGAHFIEAADMDGDGDLDLVTASQDSNTIAWYENDGAQNFTERVLDSNAIEAKTAVSIDIDTDGDLDILAASHGDDTVALYVNDGSQNFTKQVVDNTADGAYYVTAADLNGDGLIDLAAAAKLNNLVIGYFNTGSGFTRTVLANNVGGVRSVIAEDVDNDGDIDLLAASVNDNSVRFLENNGSGVFGAITIDSNAVGAYTPMPADVNQDGLVDVIAASKTDATVAVLLQHREQSAVMNAGETLAIDAALLSATDTEQSAAELVYTVVTAPALGVLRLNGTDLAAGGSFTQADVNQGLVSFATTAGTEGLDGFELGLSDGISAPAKVVFDFTIGTPASGSGLVSDDFAGGSLDPAVWSIEGPAGVSANLASNASDAYLELVTPNGDYDAWKTNNSARAMQDIADEDFQAEARFLTTPADRFQLQGLLVEQDADNWVRFDTYSDGSVLRIFAAVTVNGSSSSRISTVIQPGDAQYLRVDRAGDTWTYEYSADGSNWTTGGSFTHALNATSAGVFAGNTAQATGYTAQVDYFEVAHDPIADEDGSITPGNQAPQAADDGLAVVLDTALVIGEATLLSNDGDPDGDPITFDSFTNPSNGTLADNGDGTLTYTPNAGYEGPDSFTYTISDDSGLTDTAAVNLTVSAPGNQAPQAADDGLAVVLDTALVIDEAALLSNDSDPDGDPITFDSFTNPSNGTLTDNGDGTLTYTPDAGYEGPDSFTYTVSDDSGLTDTATVNLTVSAPAAGSGLVSDDFSGAALDPAVWSIEGPAGVSANLGVAGTEAYLELVTPDGNFDAWKINNSARAMQDIADEDFQVEARFLTTPADRFQLQGILVEQDAGNWMRFDTYSDGSVLRVFAGVTVNGSSSSRVKAVIPAGEAEYLRVNRAGDTWTYEYSADGSSWTTAVSFTHALNATSAGVFAGNTAQAAGYTAQVDYFEVASDPITGEDNQTPQAADDALAAAMDTPLVIDTGDLLANDSDPDGDPISITALGSPANGTLADNGDGTLTYTPDAGYEGPDSFTYTISDGSLSDTATVNLTVSAPLPDSGLVSDDFSGGTLDPAVWTVEGPAGVAAGLGASATDAYLELITPDGNFDAWKTNNSARAMQDIADEDFQAEARFLTTPTDRFQMQGILVEQDAGNWVRFDTYSDGSVLRVFAGVTVNGSSSSRVNATIQAGDAQYLRVDRAGDTWTYEYSADGSSWTTAVSFTHALNATSAGVFAGNTAQATGYTAQVDYFEVAGDPIADEDGSITPGNQAPQAADDGLAVVLDTALVIGEATLLSNDGDPDGDPITFDSFTNPSNGTLADNGDGTLTYTPDAGYEGPDSFTYTISDDSGLTDTATVNLTVSAPGNQAPQAADDGLAVVLDTALVIDEAALLSNDSDPDGDPITFDSFTNPSNGTLTDNGDGTLTYTPDAGYEGPDSFTYTVSDDSGLTDTATVNLTVSAPAAGSGLVSDDFAGGTLDPAVWTVEGPAGVAAGLGANATDAYLELITPDGNFDAWKTNNSARAMQDIADEDFQAEARFLTTPTDRFQMQGILVEQDAGNWVRFDTYSDGSVLRVFAGVTVNGSSSSRVNATIQAGDAQYLRVDRAGDVWTYEYSADGSSWTTAVSFTHALNATSAGVFAGNTGLAAGYTAQVDYFEVASDPIADEDGSFTPVNTAPDAVDDIRFTDIGASLVIATSGLLANDSDPDGDPITFGSFTNPANGTLTDNGDGTLTYTPDAGYEGPDSFTYTISDDGGLSDTAAVNVAVGPVIDVWYGPTQTFGQPGVPQTWVNILGDVFDEGLVSLSYTLNGGAERSLSVGPDQRRLEKAGDFNIDIAYAELDPTAADDVVSIIARYDNGATYTQDVTIQYEGGSDWDPNYSIDWSAVTNIQDVAQVVDGNWMLTGDGVRPDELGFDRFIALGDDTWDFFEARVAVTPHDMSIVGGLFGFGLWWNGHTDDSAIQWQPLRGFTPSEFLFYNQHTGTPHFEIFPNTGDTNYALAEGTRFNFLMRVEQSGTFDRTYKMKVWEEGTAEPVDWLMDLTIGYDDPITGSFALVTHHYDIEFHDIDITEIEGGDVTIGDDTAEVLAAVEETALLPGLGELDVFTGNGGDDVFVFGENGTVYYDDGDGATSGGDDYGYVWDFTAGDKVRLAGTSSDYVLTEDAAGLPGGTAIWLAGSGGDQDELIGVISNVYGLSLTGDAFEFSVLV